MADITAPEQELQVPEEVREEVEELAPPPPEQVRAPAPAPEAQPGLIGRFKDSVMRVLGDVAERATPWVEKAGYIASFAAELAGAPVIPELAVPLKLALLGASGGLLLSTGEQGRKLGFEITEKHPKAAGLLRAFAKGAIGGGFSGLALKAIANLLYPGLIEKGINTANDILAGGAKEAAGVYGRAFGVPAPTKEILGFKFPIGPPKPGVGLPQAIGEQFGKVTGVPGIGEVGKAVEAGAGEVGKVVQPGIDVLKTIPGEATKLYTEAAPLKPLGEAAAVTGGLWIGARLVRGTKRFLGLEPKAAPSPPGGA